MKSFYTFCAIVMLAKSVFAQSEGWDLQIVPTSSHANSSTSIITGTEGLCFYVVLRNTSKATQTVWREWCSDGYFCLSFEVRLADGTVYHVKKKGRPWARNFRDPFSVLPNHLFVLPVSFSKNIWEGLPDYWRYQTVYITAKYENSKSTDPNFSHIWSGVVLSQPLTSTLYLKRENTEPSSTSK